MGDREYIHNREDELIKHIRLIKPLTDLEVDIIKYAHAFGMATTLLTKNKGFICE